MSSNPYHNHSVITRSNYEEYFLLYVDDELTADEKAAVDQFVLLHPDLAQELEILQQAKLPEDFIGMEEKEMLFSGSMKMKASEEALMLYIDNELDEESRVEVEARLKEDAAYRLQYELLLKTKSDAGEVISCTFKEELYRRETRKIPVLWWRIAAAVVIVLSTGILFFTSQQENSSTGAGAVAVNQPPAAQNTPGTGVPTKAGQQTTPTRITPADAPDMIIKEEPPVPSGNVKEVNNETTPVLAMQNTKRNNTLAKSEHQYHTANKPVAAQEGMEYPVTAKRDRDIVLTPEIIEEPVKKSLTAGNVTSNDRYAYNSIDAPVNAVFTDADDDNEKSRSSLKGLLRKATRYVERRTNINVTNENEELLIGSVAISLK